MQCSNSEAFWLLLCSSFIKEEHVSSVGLFDLLTAKVVRVLATQHEIAFYKQMQHETFHQRPSIKVVTQTELIKQVLGYRKLLWGYFYGAGSPGRRHL